MSMTYADLDELEVVEKVVSCLRRAEGDEKIAIERIGEKWTLTVRKPKLNIPRSKWHTHDLEKGEIKTLTDW